MNDQKLLDKIAFNVIQGSQHINSVGNNLKMKDQPGVTELMHEALNQNIDPKEIIAESLAKPMGEVIDRYENDEYLAPHVMLSAKSAGIVMDMLAPLLKEAGIERDKFVIATVKGDLHDIGLKMVTWMLKGIGYETINLGIDVSANRIVKAVKNHRAAYVGLSAFNSLATGEMGHVIKELEAVGIRDHVKVIIGGAAASEQLAEKIGADAYCENAFQVPEMLKHRDSGLGIAGVDLNKEAA